MSRGLVFVGWLALVVVGFGFAPPQRPDQTAWITDLLLGRWQGENPAVVALFQVMGVWPALLATLTVDRFGPGPDRRLPAWPFALASFALGAYAMLPWFFLPRGGGPFASATPVRRGLAAVLGVAGAALIGWGLTAGDLAGLAHTARTDGFVWPMSLDFVACTAISVGVARARDDSRLPWWIPVIPLVGAAVWAAARSGTRAPAGG